MSVTPSQIRRATLTYIGQMPESQDNAQFAADSIASGLAGTDIANLYGVIDKDK